MPPPTHHLLRKGSETVFKGKILLLLYIHKTFSGSPVAEITEQENTWGHFTPIQPLEAYKHTIM